MYFTRRGLIVAAAGSAMATAIIGKREAYAGNLRIRGIFETPLEEPFVTQMHRALKRLATERGLDYQYSDSVKSSDFQRVLGQWCEDEVELIVGDAYGTEQICRRVAKDYPKVSFVMASAIGPTEPNFSTFYGQINEPAYLAGILAGKLSKSGKVGAVSGIAVPTTNALINAFRAGARDANPNVRFKAAFIGSFFDPPKARESTISMADQGVDVVFAERLGVIEAAAQRKMIAIGNVTDQAPINPEVVATSVIWDPYPIFKKSVDAAKSKSIAATDYSALENIANGVNYLAPFGAFESKIPSDVKVLIDTKTKEIASGKFIVPYDESEPKSE